jgi:hypothetical protein
MDTPELKLYFQADPGRDVSAEHKAQAQALLEHAQAVYEVNRWMKFQSRPKP